MSVRRNHRKKWIVDITYTHSDGRVQRIAKTSPVQSRRGAEQYERQIRAELLAGTYNKSVETKEVPTFQEFVEQRWLPTYPVAAGNSDSTRQEKDLHCRLYLVPVLGQHRLPAVRGEVVDQLFAELRRKKLAPKTIKNVRATLRRILASGVEWGVIESVPALPKVKVPDPSWDFYSAEESARLLAACRDEESRALLLFALRTGARAGEQIALRWGDVDLMNGVVVFRRSSTRGKVGPTKSGRERRVPMTDDLKQALKAHRHLRGPLVFCNADGRPLTIWQLHERLRTACRRSGLRQVRWHDLRHSFASQCAAAGVPLRQVQEWLGHTTITMTMRYAHLVPGAAAELIQVLQREHSANSSGREPQNAAIQEG